MNELRRKVLLPAFQLSELTTQDDPRGIKRTIKQGKGRTALTYWYRFVSHQDAVQENSFNLFPVVLDRRSAPWALGMLFILSRLEGNTQPQLRTARSLASDLGAFKEWLDLQENCEELLFKFPKPKLRRTTYRYRGFLQRQIQAREIAMTTARRRMGTVISFYKWLTRNKVFTPEHPLWEEKEYRLSVGRTDGQLLSRAVASTDLHIPAPKAEEQFDGIIDDGEKLRPLTGKEQDWLIEAAEVKGNSECLLIQLFMLGTGARIESTCTLRARHFSDPAPRYSKGLTGEGEVYRLKAGPGTGIETKNSKSGTFQVPRVLYELLHTYTTSKRAALRRRRYIEQYGEHPDIYLFVTQQGNPYYTAKNESQRFNPKFRKRYERNGQTLHQFLRDQAIPYVCEKYEKSFFYRPHYLRASFGMNMTDELLKQVEKGKITLHKARLIVKDLMWHTSVGITDQYLDYKKNIDVLYKAVDVH